MSKEQATNDVVIEPIRTSKIELPEVLLRRAGGMSCFEAAEKYFGGKATPLSELPQEEPSEEYLIDFEEDTNE